jgi:hypothetical protein
MNPGRCSERFNGPNPLLEPPSIFGSPILEAPVDAEIMGPVLCDIGFELRVLADGNKVGLLIRQDRFSLLRFCSNLQSSAPRPAIIADSGPN